ncbi:hypothetical protein K501DRAFT_329370 [Backusella circina FSU 941]|nr:hypothetical protein K501DRAFT_233896 [Backusella circina FSU 941]KAI8889307.1 hypothetical protein K501DRAFT_329370 [Backusella circina FSU 941]
MGLGLEKCCCLIPLRLGTFIIAIWFFGLYLFYTATGFIGVNSIVFYSGQKSIAWYYISLLFAIFICIGGLAGIIGSLFASRRFAKAFSIIVWINCFLSALVYIISLVFMSAYSQHTIDSCRVVGFVGIGNPQHDITPVQLTSSSYYSPVKYPGILTEHATSEDSCAEMTKTFTIAFGVVILVVQFLQVYFAYVVGAYAKRLSNGARHHRLHAQQIKDFEESRYHMSTVY